MEITKLFYIPLFSSTITLNDSDVYPAITKTEFDGSDYLSKDVDVLNTTFLFLRDPITKFVDEIMSSLNFEAYSIFSSWLTRVNNDNMPRIDHIHTNSFLSGVVYLHEDSSPLLIRNPSPWRWSSGKSNEVMSSGYLFEPKRGDIIIFPSHISHLIMPVNNNKNRYSIAFNVIPTGIFGNKDSKICLSTCDN